MNERAPLTIILSTERRENEREKLYQMHFRLNLRAKYTRDTLSNAFQPDLRAKRTREPHNQYFR